MQSILMAQLQKEHMTECAPLFHYVPLSGPHHIRILVLQPAPKANHPIQCSFREISLEESPDAGLGYEALSYTWGVPQGTQPILCEGRTILVTPNCEQALLHLRQKSRTRDLWIDAICIDQQSVPEKNQQVPMMGEIYRCASSSILWLGRDTDARLSAVLQRAARYGNVANNMMRTFRKVRKSTDSREYEGHWQAQFLSVAESERVADLCTNEWFGRMWTIQEFLLSNSAIFLMGNISCPSRALFTYYRLGKNLVKRADLEHYRMRNALLTFSPSSTDGTPFERFMVVVIQLAALNKSTDARDKVYGMVAFLKWKWPDFQLPAVDYAKSVAEIYEHFTRSLIITTKGLWPLEFANGLSGPESHDLPSWVLDLRDPDRLAPDWGSSIQHSGFSKSEWKFPTQLYNPGQLSVRAKRIGQVARTSVRMPFWDSKSSKTPAKEMGLARTACLSEWTAFVTNLDMHEDQTNSPYIYHAPSKERRESHTWEQVGIPCSDPNTRALEAFTTELDYLRLRYEPEDEVRVDSWPFESTGSVKKNTKRRKAKKKAAEKDPSHFDEKPHDQCLLFLMSTGHLAETPGDVHVGDKVYVVEGSSFPLVLRRRGKQFLVIGKADIYQMRKLETWQPNKLDEDPKAHDIVLV